MNILITGATGFLGSHLSCALLTDGHQITALSRKISKRTNLGTYEEKINWCNIEDGLETIFDQNPIDCIIHTATNYGRNQESSFDVFSTNTAFPLSLLQLAITAGVKRFINTDTPLPKYINDYSLSKTQFTEWGMQYAEKNKIQFINCKLEHIYGPKDDSSKFISYVIQACKNNFPVLNLTLGEQYRDFIYIDETVFAYRYIVNHEHSLGFEEFEIGTGEAICIKDLVQLIHKLTQSQTQLIFGAIPYRANEVMQSKANITKIQALGWRNKTNIIDGIKKTIEFNQ